MDFSKMYKMQPLKSHKELKMQFLVQLRVYKMLLPV